MAHAKGHWQILEEQARKSCFQEITEREEVESSDVEETDEEFIKKLAEKAVIKKRKIIDKKTDKNVKKKIQTKQVATH